jgi:hypothetical protein
VHDGANLFSGAKPQEQPRSPYVCGNEIGYETEKRELGCLEYLYDRQTSAVD